MSERHLKKIAMTSDGERIAYTHILAPADSPRITFVHSLALDRSVWSGVIDALEGRAQMIALDCRGHGQSSKARGPYTTERMADDIADVLDDAGWQSTTIAGCSMGGCISQQFASRYSARSDAALFVDTTAWYGSNARANWASRAATAQRDGLDSLIAFQLTRWFGDDFREGNAPLLERLTDVFTSNEMECYTASCLMLGETDLRQTVAEIECPVGVIVGEDDKATPPAMANELAEILDIGHAEVVRGTRHLTPLEAPQTVAQRLMSLAKTDPED